MLSLAVRLRGALGTRRYVSGGVPRRVERWDGHLQVFDGNFEKVMTSRLELLGWACRDREDSDTYDLERWTANCGGDAAMARRVIAEARARVQRHVLEGTRPDDSDDTDEEARRPAPAKPSGGRKKGKKGRRKK